MCRPPGATRASPACTGSPSAASFTESAERWSSRAANAAVNFSGMCWTMTMPGASAGIAVSTSSSAWVPPVEAPSAITL